MGTCYIFAMRVLGSYNLGAYAKRKPRKKEYLLAFRGLVETASWKRTKDVEAQFGHVASVTPPNQITFDFPDEDLRIEMRVNFGLGLARILDVGPSTKRKER
jgi:mRNA-degrading endonuclease HigB of HigAB toxin-antitoxin module